MPYSHVPASNALVSVFKAKAAFVRLCKAEHADLTHWIDWIFIQGMTMGLNSQNSLEHVFH